MPTKNFDKEVKEPDGKVYQEPKASGKFTGDGRSLFEVDGNGETVMSPLKFNTVISNILRNNTKNDNLSSDEYVGQWRLMEKFAAGGDIELSDTQIATIRDLLVKTKISPFIIGQICAYLNES